MYRSKLFYPIIMALSSLFTIALATNQELVTRFVGVVMAHLFSDGNVDLMMEWAKRVWWAVLLTVGGLGVLSIAGIKVRWGGNGDKPERRGDDAVLLALSEFQTATVEGMNGITASLEDHRGETREEIALLKQRDKTLAIEVKALKEKVGLE
jgi:hypothetical protein